MITNAVWYAAASLVVARLFGPPGLNAGKAQANFELLLATLNDFELFWGTPKILEDKIKSLEVALRALRAKTLTMPSSPEHDELTTHSRTEQVPQFELNQVVDQDTQNRLDTTHVNPVGINPFAWEPDWMTFDFNSMPTLDLEHPDSFGQQITGFETGWDQDPFVLGNTAGLNDLFAFSYQ